MPLKSTPITVKFGLFVGLIIVFTLGQWSSSLSQTTQILSVAGTGSNVYPGQETTYRLELLNHTDQIVFDGVLAATLPAGFTYVANSTIVMGEGWPMASREPISNGQTLTWGPYHLPAAGVQAHNPFGIHTLMDSCNRIPALHLEGAKELAGSGGHVTQLFYPIDVNTTGPSQCAINYVQEAYARNLIPILRLQGHRVNGIWQAPDPGPDGDYSEIARAFVNYVAGIPRRDTNPLYIAVWNEPDLWIEWSGQPNATQYARFFVAVSNAIRQLGDARIRVVNGALTPGNMSFLDQMLSTSGFRDAFDVWASHCYPYNHPAWYNIHNGTARYGTYAIDCYLEEVAVINDHGRTGIKIMLTETGYALGNNTFEFEGFTRINETNRADYIASAFQDYWQNWPEIVAVTPFELTDPSGHWATFDWVYPYWPYPTHLQYDTVAALPKPAGQPQPYGYQVTFKARISPDVIPNTYTLQLKGSDRDGHTALADEAAPVIVLDPAEQRVIYLPVILKGPGRGDASVLSATQPPSHNGALIPSHILTATQDLTTLATGHQRFDLALAGEPRALAFDEITALGAVLLADGFLEIIDLTSKQATDLVFIGPDPQVVVSGPPGAGQAYISLSDGLVKVDMLAGQVVGKQMGWGRLRGLARDTATGRLFSADAEQDRLLVFTADLSQPAAVYPLPHQPNQLILDSSGRQLFISFPAVSQVIALDADNLTITAQAETVGGPLLELAFDANRNRLFALGVLAPNHHGITVWQAPDLSQIALVAGTGDFSLATASALALTPRGNLVISAGNGLWQIVPDTFAASFTINRIDPAPNITPAGGLAVHRNTGAVYLLDAQANTLGIYQ